MLYPADLLPCPPQQMKVAATGTYDTNFNTSHIRSLLSTYENVTTPFHVTFRRPGEEAGVEEMEWLNRRRTPLLHFNGEVEQGYASQNSPQVIAGQRPTAFVSA